MRQRLDPAISSLDREAASEALRGEHLVPVCLAVGLAILQEERAVAKQLAAVRAGEALRVEGLTNRIQAISLRWKMDKFKLNKDHYILNHIIYAYLDLSVALGAGRSDKLLEAVLAVQVALLLDETNVGQLATTISVHAHKVVRAPDAAQSSDERAPKVIKSLN